MTNEEITIKIEEICGELTKASEAISKLPPVTYKSKAVIRFYGGIIGAIQDYREDKRAVKLMNAPLYENYTFSTFAVNIMTKTEELAKLQAVYQNNSTKEDAAYYGNVEKITIAVLATLKAWHEYSPELAALPISMGDKENISFASHVNQSIKESFKLIDLPEGLAINEENDNTGSGCLGSFLLMLIIPVAALLIGTRMLN